MSVTAELLGAAQRDRDRYREALTTIQAASALLLDQMDQPPAVLVDRDTGHLSWSAVHTFITDVVDLGMPPEAALADLTDDPAGV